MMQWEGCGMLLNEGKRTMSAVSVGLQFEGCGKSIYVICEVLQKCYNTDIYFNYFLTVFAVFVGHTITVGGFSKNIVPKMYLYPILATAPQTALASIGS